MSHDKGSAAHWILSDAGEGKVFITSRQGERLRDADGIARVASAGVPDGEAWVLADAGEQKVFLRGDRDERLKDHDGELQLTTNADEWEKWFVTAVDGSPVCQFSPNRLFCFTVMRSWGNDLEILEAQSSRRAGIFGCDERMILSDKEIDLGKTPGEDRTIAISGHDSILSEGAGLYKNSDLFLKIWDAVDRDGRYKYMDWTVKVDPDAVFLPDRLKVRLGGGSHSKHHPTFFANCGAKVDVQSSEHPNFMYGALEVFSQAAVTTYFKGKHRCQNEIRAGAAHSMWEERYMTKCLELLGVAMNTWRNLHLLSDAHCDNSKEIPDCAGNAVAFHNFSTPEAYLQCWADAHPEDGMLSPIQVKK